MKKLTAGIFSVLMGLVAVNAADAAVASKGYVTGQINAVNAEVAKKVDKSAYDTTIEALNTKDASQDEEIAKRTVLSVSGAGLKLTEGVLTLDGIATSAGLSTLQGTVDILNAGADQTGSVKQQIADAIASEVTRSNLYADAAETDAINAAKTYTDGREAAITTAYKAADQGLQTQITENTNKFANYTTTADMNTALGLKEDVANKVTDTNENLSAEEKLVKYTSVSYVDAKVAAANSSVSNLSGRVDTIDSKLAAQELTNEGFEGAINAINDEATGILATAKADTASQISALDLQAISRVPAECSEPTKYCALTTNGTSFVWEVIERDPSEFEADGITLKSEGRTVVEGVTE